MSDLAITILIVTLTILLFAGLLVLLLIRSQQNRIHHEREVMQAEREAQQQTLQEIGRELHDNLGQLLTVARMGLDNAIAERPSDQCLNEVLGTVELSIEETRRLGRSLNADMWAQRSFPEAVQAEVERLERTGIARVTLHKEHFGVDPSPSTKTILFRVFQEVLNNALKHARAERITITLGPPPVLFTVTDDGHGFTTDGAGRGNGLINIRRRCALISAEAVLTTAPGQGCSWSVHQYPNAHDT